MSKQEEEREKAPSDHEGEDDYDDLPELKFNITISKVKIRELKSSQLKNKKAYITFKLKEKTLKCPEVEIADDVLKFPDTHSFTYETSLVNMNRDKLEILVGSGKSTICSTEVSVKSIIDGPVMQNIALICNGLIIGRISFEMEMLEVSHLTITPMNFICELGEENVGTFSISLKFASDFSKESKQSTISEEPNWNFTPNDTEVPDLLMPVTMKNIRDAALQIRLYKHHKVEMEMTAECWVSFTKMFAEDMEAIYRTESFLASKSKESGTRLDFEKLVKSMKRVHNKKINENLWLCGRKIGVVKGNIRLMGIPTFIQLISGVNTEKGYSVQSTVYMSELDTKGKEDLPKKILDIIKITNELQDSVQYKPGRGGIVYEKEMLKKKKDCFETLFSHLQSSQKDSMISFVYKNQKSLIKAQEALINLGSHLTEFSKLVNYDIKPSYFRCLTFLIKRGELDIGYLSAEGADESIMPLKIQTAADYLKFLHNTLSLSLSRMVFKGVDKITEEFVYETLAISWFRVPEFQETVISILKEKSYYSIQEWRKTDTDLDDEKASDISRELDWKAFYTLIPANFKKDSFNASLLAEAWRQKMQKRGLAFFNFLKQLVAHICDQTMNRKIHWSSIPGYKVLLKAFLIELKERAIAEYPEALVECTAILLQNVRLLNVMVRIIFSKTNIYDFNTVQECFRVLDVIFSAIFNINRTLPPTFDFDFFFLGIQITLNDENGLNVAKCLSFLYNQYHLLRGSLREKITDLIFGKKFKAFFFHWCRDLRNILYNLILYRVFSIKKIYFEPEDDEKNNDIALITKIKKKILEFDENGCRKEQKPYFNIGMQEYLKTREDYKKWKKGLTTNTGKLYGCSDTFPYPVVTIKYNFMDLAEKKLEEKW